MNKRILYNPEAVAAISFKQRGVFSCLPDYVKGELLLDKKLIAFSPDERIIYDRSNPKGIWVIHKGHARVGRLDPSGELQLTLILPPGDSFGELTCFPNNREPIDAIAVDEFEGFWIPVEEFQAALEKYPESNLLVQTRLSSQVLQGLDIVLMNRSQNASERLRWNLKYFCGHKPSPIHCPISQNELAQLVGISRMTISKELKGMEDKGILERDYGGVVILKPELL